MLHTHIMIRVVQIKQEIERQSRLLTSEASDEKIISPCDRRCIVSEASNHTRPSSERILST